MIINALEVYPKERSPTHPLVTQLQSRDAPSDILSVLQQQVQGLYQSRNGNDRWTKWLDPTINVLAFSESGGTVDLDAQGRGRI